MANNENPAPRKPAPEWKGRPLFKGGTNDTKPFEPKAGPAR